MRKPKISAQSLKILSMIDEYIRRYDVRGRFLPHAASDVLDGAVFNSEIDKPIRERWLTVMNDCPPRYAGDECGTSWTVHLTEKAILLIWPHRIAEPSIPRKPRKRGR